MFEGLKKVLPGYREAAEQRAIAGKLEHKVSELEQDKALLATKLADAYAMIAVGKVDYQDVRKLFINSDIRVDVMKKSLKVSESVMKDLNALVRSRATEIRKLKGIPARKRN